MTEEDWDIADLDGEYPFSRDVYYTVCISAKNLTSNPSYNAIEIVENDSTKLEFTPTVYKQTNNGYDSNSVTADGDIKCDIVYIPPD